MPITYSVDRRHQRVVLRVTETRQVGEWEAVLGELMDDPRYAPGIDVLIDATEAEPIEPANLRRVIAFYRAHSGPLGLSRCAVVIQNAAGYGMTRMAQGLAGGDAPEIEIFWTVTDALAWLDTRRVEQLG